MTHPLRCPLLVYWIPPSVAAVAAECLYRSSLSLHANRKLRRHSVLPVDSGKTILRRGTDFAAAAHEDP